MTPIVEVTNNQNKTQDQLIDEFWNKVNTDTLDTSRNFTYNDLYPYTIKVTTTLRDWSEGELVKQNIPTLNWYAVNKQDKVLTHGVETISDEDNSSSNAIDRIKSIAHYNIEALLRHKNFVFTANFTISNT